MNNDNEKMVEPFNLIGKRSIIYSKEEAAKILKDNSYYIFAASALNIATSIFLFIYPASIGMSGEVLLLQGIFYWTLGVGVRKFKSRVASLLALGSFGCAILMKMLQEGESGFYLFFFIFCMASYRAVKASFYYHEKNLVEKTTTG